VDAGDAGAEVDGGDLLHGVAWEGDEGAVCGGGEGVILYAGEFAVAVIFKAGGDALGDEASAPIKSMKKDAAALHAEKLLAPTRWVPAELHAGLKPA
jgi:hypothetical protein